MLPPKRPSFRPIQYSPKLVEPSTFRYPISSRTEPAAEPFQSLATLRAAAQRPATAMRYRRSPTQMCQSQTAASHGTGGFSRLRQTAVLIAAHQRASSEREAMPAIALPTFKQELESLPDSPVASEPSPKRWADYNESDEEAYLAMPPDFGEEAVVGGLVVEQPAGPAAVPGKLQWSVLVDLPDENYFATPPAFEDKIKLVVVAAEQPASPTAPAPLRWSDLVDLPPDDDDKYFAAPPVFLTTDC